MLDLIVRLKVKDKIEAYQIVSKLGFRHKVLSAKFGNKIYYFDEKIETKKPRFFLSEKFGKKLGKKL